MPARSKQIFSHAIVTGREQTELGKFEVESLGQYIKRHQRKIKELAKKGA